MNGMGMNSFHFHVLVLVVVINVTMRATVTTWSAWTATSYATSTSSTRSVTGNAGRPTSSVSGIGGRTSGWGRNRRVTMTRWGRARGETTVYGLRSRSGGCSWSSGWRRGVRCSTIGTVGGVIGMSMCMTFVKPIGLCVLMRRISLANSRRRRCWVPSTCWWWSKGHLEAFPNNAVKVHLQN